MTRRRPRGPRQPRLPRGPRVLVGAMALALAGLPALLSGWSVFVWRGPRRRAVYLVALPALVRIVEGRRAAVDRFVTTLIVGRPSSSRSRRWSGCSGWCSGTASPAINADFLTLVDAQRRRREQGGIYHACIGTLLITLAATVISVPIGMLTAIYLVEYGQQSRAGPGRSRSWST